MAWLYKHPRSQFWNIGWRVGKKVFNRSTKVTDRKEAEKKLAVYNLMADARRQNLLSEDFYNSLSGQKFERVSLHDATETFLDKCKGTTVADTLVRYKIVLDGFGEFVQATETTPLLRSIEGEPIQKFLNGIRERTTASTVNFYRRVLNAFFADALKNKKIRENPVKDIATYKATKEEVEVSRRPFTKEELRLIYEAAPNDFWLFAIPFGLYTGLRVGNVATMRWQDVDFEKRLVMVVDIKSPEKLTIPIESKFLWNMLLQLRRNAGKPKPDDFIFPDYAEKYLTKTGKGKNASKLSLEFRDILVTAGLAEPYDKRTGRHDLKPNGRGKRRVSPLSFHSLRHNFISMLKERGASQSVAKELAGHNSDDVNDLYTHVSEQAIRKSLKRLPEVFK